MDELQLSIYGDRFSVAFYSKKGVEFQNWFVRLAGYAFDADFEEVRPYGSHGDLKCDGRRVSAGSVFQCYAPDTMKEAELIKKIDRDFYGACSHWTGMREWIFVHNDSRGLPPKAIQHLDKLRKKNKSLRITVWSEPELQKLAMGLDISSLQALFGYAPSIRIVDNLMMSDLAPIIEALEREEPDPNNLPLTPPSIEKLKKNALSEASGLFLQIGRRKSPLVGAFFSKNPRPDVGERIAEAFRQRYKEYKALKLPADAIFRCLQDYAGFHGEPERQAAAMAVLAYFFDNCDIFEDPIVLARTP